MDKASAKVKVRIMPKNELPGLTPAVDEALQRSVRSFADAKLGQLFFALLDDEDLEQVMGDFLVPARAPASHIPPMARSAKRPDVRKELPASTLPRFYCARHRKPRSEAKRFMRLRRSPTNGVKP